TPPPPPPPPPGGGGARSVYYARPRAPGHPRGGGPRRVFSARWVGDDASFADRGGVTSPPFPELTLRDGDPLDSPLFPQVWPRA
ncbi:hypothetical protein ACSTCY_22580, partial [Klebsiella pneumoniae]